MSTLMFDGTAAAPNPPRRGSKEATLRIAALGLLSIRFIQGFVYWGGGSRRFIYAPDKLDPSATSWMAHFSRRCRARCSELTTSSPFCCIISTFSMPR
jgi:hypothetical protein